MFACGLELKLKLKLELVGLLSNLWRNMLDVYVCTCVHILTALFVIFFNAFFLFFFPLFGFLLNVSSDAVKVFAPAFAACLSSVFVVGVICSVAVYQRV